MSSKDEKTPGIRLNAYIAQAGIASRRSAEAYIREGRVKLNGIVVKELGTRVQGGDRVEFDGELLKPEEKKIYLALNKPSGYICSSSDPQSRTLAASLLPKAKERLYTVGRLDFLSSGLIFFTNDGEFASVVGHPSTAPEKEYFLETDADIDPSILQRFMKGITIEGVHYRAANAVTVSARSARIILVEGKNREIRRVLSAFGIRPKVLRRIRIGGVVLDTLGEGKCRNLSDKEIRSLMERRAGEGRE